MDRKLTPSEVDVLRAAKQGDLHRSESAGDLHQSYMDGGRRKVTGIVDRILKREIRLLEIGERNQFVRPWYLTDDGAAALAERDAAMDEESR